MSVSGLVSAAAHRAAGVQTSTDFDSVTYIRDVGGDKLDISLSAIQLALPGGGLTELGTVFFKFIMEMMWTAYMGCVWVVAWFANFAMSMSWLEAIRAPFDAIQDVLQDILRSYNLYATMLVITAFICIIWMARGRWGQGIAELFVALVIANYAIASIGSTDTDTTPIASYSPLNVMLGSDGTEDNDGDGEPDESTPGLIYQSRDFGTDIVGQLDGEIDGEAEYDAVTPGQSIVDSFIWYPIQLVNFGEVLTPRDDSGKALDKDHANYHDCEDAYALVLSYIDRYGDNENGRGEQLADDIRRLVDGPYGERAADAVGEDVRYLDEGWKVPGACVYGDEEKFENQSNLQGILTQWFLGPSVGFLGILVLIIAGAVVLAGVNAVVQCFKVLLALLVAILPKGGRRSLWVTIGSAATALLILVFAVIFLGTFLVVIQYVFASQAGSTFGQRIGTFLLIDVLLVVGLIIFWRGRKSVAQSNEKLAAAMANMTPGGGGGGGFAKGANSGGLMAGMGKFHTAMDVRRDLNGFGRRRGGGGFGGPGSVVMSGGGGRGGGSGGGAAGAARSTGGAAGAARSTGGAMVRAGAAKGAKKAVGTAALGFMTGGSSLLAQGGAVVAKSGALKAAGKGLAAASGRSARWVGNRGSYAWHASRNNWDKANRAQALNRRRELARQKRSHALGMRIHDRNTGAIDLAARLTNGRGGTALKAQERQMARKEKAKYFHNEFLRKNKEFIDKDNDERSRLSPVQRARNNEWREVKKAKLKKAAARREARRKGGFG